MTPICLSVFIVCIHKHVYTGLFLHVFQLWTLPKIRASRWNVAAIKCVWLRITKHPPVSVNAGWGKCPLLGLTNYRNSSKNSVQVWPKRLAHLLPCLNMCMTSWITYCTHFGALESCISFEDQHFTKHPGRVENKTLSGQQGVQN